MKTNDQASLKKKCYNNLYESLRISLPYNLLSVMISTWTNLELFKIQTEKNNLHVLVYRLPLYEIISTTDKDPFFSFL